MKKTLLGAFLATFICLMSALPTLAADPADVGSPKQLPTAVMTVNFVGDGYIFANERKFFVSNSTMVISAAGVGISPSLLRIGQKVAIEYHAGAKGGFVADSITVVTSSGN
ncbi:MAG: hypothetical protein HY280_06690 [Nitrospinae bacterium]|nr:hypothetical protein [Nitrospinota bacterium]